MGGILDTLRTDHANMARLLNILERQVSAFREGEAPDYEIVQGVLEYFLDYPDLCHHPKEDLLARKLLDKAGSKDSAVRGLAEQHEELGVLTRRFATVVRRVIDEAEALGVLDRMRERVRAAEGQPPLGTAGAVAGSGD